MGGEGEGEGEYGDRSPTSIGLKVALLAGQKLKLRVPVRRVFVAKLLCYYN